jgi:NTE family protein
MKTKLGVVLSGGGAKGAYEAGFLKALSEFGIQPDAIAGTSIGAFWKDLANTPKNTKGVSIFLEQIWQDLANTPALQPDKKKVFKNFGLALDFNFAFSIAVFTVLFTSSAFIESQISQWII